MQLLFNAFTLNRTSLSVVFTIRTAFDSVHNYYTSKLDVTTMHNGDYSLSFPVTTKVFNLRMAEVT